MIMPIYEYRCKDCEHVFEEWQKDFKERTQTCPSCGGQAPRIISNTSFILKGSGWYVTDYARGNGKAANGNGTNGKTAASAESGVAADAPKSAESKPAESAPAACKPDAAKSADSASS
jgi:putative FmdB family regulatory protein